MSDSRNLAYAQILSRLIQVETISANGDKDLEKFERFHILLQETFTTIKNDAALIWESCMRNSLFNISCRVTECLTVKELTWRALDNKYEKIRKNKIYKGSIL